MIKSIKFTGEFGYITKTVEPPTCPVRGYGEYGFYKYENLSDEDKTKIDEWEKKYKDWEENHKDEYVHPQLVKNLIGRTIEFKPGPGINIIFGPNASGKTTILKAIAGKGGTTDGYPNLFSYLEVAKSFSEPNLNAEYFGKNKIADLMLNSAEIDWDGTPIYYDNFANRQSHGSIGDLCGSVLGDDIMTELLYVMNKTKISSGQNSIYLLNRLFDIAEQHLSFADVFKTYVNPDGSIKDDLGVNDLYDKAYRAQLEYYLSFPKALEKHPGTFLFDEIDKSMDIANINFLYNEALPRFVEKTGVQIIIISHSPLVLSDKIRNNELYNFISTDEDYTSKCFETMKALFK